MARHTRRRLVSPVLAVGLVVAAAAIGTVVAAFGAHVGHSTTAALHGRPADDATTISAPAGPASDAAAPSVGPATSSTSAAAVPAAQQTVAAPAATSRPAPVRRSEHDVNTGRITAPAVPATPTPEVQAIPDPPVCYPGSIPVGQQCVQQQNPDEVIGRAITCSDGQTGYVVDADLDTDCGKPADQRATDAPGR